MIVTDGVFSMDGTIAQLDKICDLADQYKALVMIDECHASGFMGKTGRGTHEYRNVMGRLDIITGTLGKALGGAMGGFTSGRKEIIDMLRQRSRPYLFSNSLAPSIVGASIAVIDMLSHTTALRDKLWENTRYFREQITAAGFDIKPGEHPIVPVMLGETSLAAKMAARLLLADVAHHTIHPRRRPDPHQVVQQLVHPAGKIKVCKVLLVDPGKVRRGPGPLHQGLGFHALLLQQLELE
jgi:glycine C-acetyltransferase